MYNGNGFQQSPTNEVVKNILANNKLKYEVCNAEGNWVSEGMHKTLENWSKSIYYLKVNPTPCPILIKAPTGTGKTTFVKKDLCELACEKKQMVLLLENRSALTKQIKSDQSEHTLGYSISPDAYNGIHQIENLVVLSYQECADLNRLYQCIQPIYQYIKYVVFDEAHFFTSDALFNSQTHYILQNILTLFYKTQRFYMTATPDDVQDIIAMEEWRMKTIMENNKAALSPKAYEVITLPDRIYRYNIPHRPHNISLFFFYSWETIQRKIVSSPDNEKWLIFTKSITDGKNLHKNVSNSDFISTENNSNVKEKLIYTSKIPRKVLITTKVLDNGINIIDDALCNIVIDSVDSVDILQMLGRKRRRDNEKINLYIVNKTNADFKSYRKSIDQNIAAINNYEENYSEFFNSKFNNYEQTTREMFSYDSSLQKHTISEYSRYILGKRKGEYIKMEVALEDNENAFAESICSLFNVEFDASMKIDKEQNANGEIDPDIREALLQTIHEYENKSFTEEELRILLKQVLKIIEPIRRELHLKKGKSENNAKGIINEILGKDFVTQENIYEIIKENKAFHFKVTQKSEPQP